MKGHRTRENKFTADDLKTMQSWSLERKIGVAQTRIYEWYLRHDKQVYISFSGGKDSTVLLDLARRIDPDIPAVFVNTGLEFPEIRDFVKTIPNVTVLTPEMDFRTVIDTYGYPIVSKGVSRAVSDVRKLGDDCWAARTFDGREYGSYNYKKWEFLLDAPFDISNKCCDVMKKKPFALYEKETGRKPIVGTMACESKERKAAWMYNGCNAFEASHPKSQPMSIWLEQDVLQYLYEFEIPYSKAYGDIVIDDKGVFRTTKYHRTGCIFCGYGCHLDKAPNRFQLLKTTHPMLWDYCMRPWTKGGLGMKCVLGYIDVDIE